jgi:glycogen debranching enzyme
MKYRIREGFSDRKGVISNTHGFLSSYLDGSFQEKWNGYWIPSSKYLDYFAVKINGIWLNDETMEEASYGDEITSYHCASSLKVTQKIEAPEKLPGFRAEWIIKNNSDESKAVRISLEPGVDIRPRTQDIVDQDYRIETNKAGMKISAGEKYLTVSGENFRFEEDAYTKEHYPGERQKCLIPGDIFSMIELEPGEKKRAEIEFKTDGESFMDVSNSKNVLRQPELGRTFNYCIESMENLLYGKNSGGVIAGHPWFQNYWARDSFWTCLGMIDAGMFEEAERILENFAERENFPTKILTDGGEEQMERADSIPMFAIAVEKLDRHYGTDLKGRAEFLLEQERPEKEVVNHATDGTWMDTLDRSKAVDIQSLWIEALKRYDKDTENLREGLEKFEREDYMIDNFFKDFESINPAVPLMFGQIEDENAEKYLEKINGEFSSRYGARTRSVTDPGYEASGYHTGSVWGLTTCWAAAANLKYGQDEHGKNFLKKLTQFIDRNQLGALPEVVDADTGESLGCDEQAWSAGMLVHVIDTYLLGIEVKEDKVVIDPADIDLFRKSKKIRGVELDLKVNNGEAKVLNEPDLEIEVK